MKVHEQGKKALTQTQLTGAVSEIVSRDYDPDTHEIKIRSFFSFMQTDTYTDIVCRGFTEFRRQYPEHAANYPTNGYPEGTV